MYHNMKSKFYTLAASFALMAGVVSCDYLDVAPPETVDRDDILKTQVDALEYLYGCYGPIQSADLIRNFRPYRSRGIKARLCSSPLAATRFRATESRALRVRVTV